LVTALSAANELAAQFSNTLVHFQKLSCYIVHYSTSISYLLTAACSVCTVCQ